MKRLSALVALILSVLASIPTSPIIANPPVAVPNELACQRAKLATHQEPLPCMDFELTIPELDCSGDSPGPGSVVDELTAMRVLNSELVARLELTQAILELQNHYTEQILLLERQNAKLVAEAAELRIKNELNEQLTAGLIERTELAAKLSAAHDWISSRTAYEASLPNQARAVTYVTSPQYEETIAAIQEDISNLRRQLPLLKRTPVPFAASGSIRSSSSDRESATADGATAESTEEMARSSVTDDSIRAASASREITHPSPNK